MALKEAFSGFLIITLTQGFTGEQFYPRLMNFTERSVTSHPELGYYGISHQNLPAAPSYAQLLV